jgi:hypothetical protein
MKNHSFFRRAGALTVVLFLGAAFPASRASDHADPMSLNAFQVQKDPAANITDLHAFIVDKDGHLVKEGDPTVGGDQLIISLCVRRALQPQQIAGLDLKGFKFRVHLDMQPPIRFFDETRTREGANYAAVLAKRTEEVNARAAELTAAKGDKTKEAAADAAWKAALARRGTLVGQHEADRSMQALYGGIFTQPDAIADSGLLEFELDLVKDPVVPEDSEARLTRVRIEGIPGKSNIVAREKVVSGKVVIAANGFQKGLINVQTGVFDDPFIFPRFFRRNVVGIVASIPLLALHPPANHGPILLWATTHDSKGAQIDHVGRSLRTQLPRFGYLNDKHPAEHVKEITRVHDKPDIMEDVLATFLAPLEAHRHYDSAPDVMVYDLTKPARFPNGRWLEDDVAKTLADAGETLLLELSYAESRQFPRATTNDKRFMLGFPYLAPRWKMKEVAAHSQPGTTMSALTNPGGKTPPFLVPLGGDPAAIAFPNFKLSTWRTLWLITVAALALFALLLLFVVRSNVTRVIVVIIAIIIFLLLLAVRAPHLPPSDMMAMAQPSQKLCRLILGGLVIGVFKVCWLVLLGRRWGAKYAQPEPKYPPLRQELMTGEVTSPYLAGESTYDEITDALFNPKTNGQYYAKWGEPGQKPLPIYRVTVALLARGLFRAGKDFAMLSAARRTLKSRADLRWGPDKKGWHRIVHTMGVCLEGTWTIDDEPKDQTYTGYFKKGKEGRVVGRYSLGGNEVRNGHKRSLALVGKIFPPKEKDEPGKPTPRAHFITQEDLGGAYTDSVIDAQLFNSPPVTLFNRGPGVFSFLVVILGLMQADKEPSERQLYEIAELEKPDDEETRCPRFMRLTIDRSRNYPKVVGDEADFREEILGLIYQSPDAPRPLVFNIEVSNTGWRSPLQTLHGQEPWYRIGRITFDQAAASHNGDFVVHFHHPAWRKDRNDPSSVARLEHRS